VELVHHLDKAVLAVVDMHYKQAHLQTSAAQAVVALLSLEAMPPIQWQVLAVQVQALILLGQQQQELA
jgi:hypothetical protein